MSISVQCPRCARSLRTSVASAGKRVKCGACGQLVLVPPAPPLPRPHAAPLLPTKPTATRNYVPTRSNSPWPLYLAGAVIFLCVVVGTVLIVIAVNTKPKSEDSDLLTRADRARREERSEEKSRPTESKPDVQPTLPADRKSDTKPAPENHPTPPPLPKEENPPEEVKPDRPKESKPEKPPEKPAEDRTTVEEDKPLDRPVEPGKGVPPKVAPPAWKVVQRFVGHTRAINCIAVSRDGRYLVTAGGSLGEDTTLRLWDMATGQEIRRFSGHTKSIEAAVFSADGTRLLTGSSDQTVRLWEVSNGKQLQLFKGHEYQYQKVSPVTSVALSEDGLYALSGGDDGLRLWDTKNGKQLHRFRGFKTPVHCVDFTPDGQHVLAGSGESEPGERLRAQKDHTIRMWNVQTKELVREFKGHDYAVYCLAISPDGKWLASGSGDRTIRLWDLQTGQEKQRLKGHRGEVRAVAFAPDGQRLLSGAGWEYVFVSQKPGEVSYGIADDPTIRLWDRQTGQEVQHTSDGQKGYHQSVAFTPDGRHALYCSANNSVLLVELPR